MSKCFEVVSDLYGYWVIDTTIEEDGETPCNVWGSVKRADAQRKADQLNAHEEGKLCDEENCQECCPHDERDHGICLDCGQEEDPGAAIDRAMDAMEDR